MYENSPYNILARHNVNNMEEARQNILGGETAIWTEQSDAGNILSKVTDLPAFVDNMADSLSPARFLPTGTNLKTWGNMIPTKFEPRSNLSLEEYGITVNNFAAVHKAHDRTDNKLQLKHFKTENLHKIEQSNKLKYDGTGFTQVSGLTDINTVAQALEVRHTTRGFFLLQTSL